MRFLLRSLVLLLLVLWVGGSMFFPIVAASAFSVLPIHQAGLVVGKSLPILQFEGLVAGALLILFLALGQRIRAFSRNVIAPIILVAIMMGLTAFSQFSIIPRMQNARIEAGGNIESVPRTNPYRAEFDRLHREDVKVFEIVLISGIVATLAVAWAAAPGATTNPRT
jgi:hypothetical protein